MCFAQSDATGPAPPDPPGDAWPADTTPADAKPGLDAKRATEAVLPWFVSGVLHLAIVLVAVLIAFSTFVEPDDEEVVIPSISYAPAPQPIRFQTQQVERRIQERSLAPVEVETPVSLETEPLGVGELAELDPPPAAEPFAELASEDDRFEVRFFVKGNARKIAFLIDASGSLIDTLPFVISHLETTVAGLSEPQEFTVMFFKGDDVIEVAGAGLKRATAQRKGEVIRWLRTNRIAPEQGTDPINAIRRALRYRPQLLFILSDNLTNAGAGPFEVEQWRLLREIEEANLGNTKIKTIQFLYEDPLDRLPQREGTLKRIARQFGAGRDGDLNEWYTFIDERDLNIQ